MQTRTVESARYVWKFPPERNGGLLARDPDTMLTQLDQALEDPTCCQARTREFLGAYMLGADGASCERIHEALVELVSDRAPTPGPPFTA